jgi:lipoate-protein ligase B
MRLIEPRGLAYAQVHALQLALVEEVAAGAESALVLVEHEPVVTVGRGARAAGVHTALPVVEVERGGGVTAHGPGQLVGYPIVPLADHDLHGHLRRIEAVLVRGLAAFGVAAAARAGATGVWTEAPGGPRKLASIGIAARRWVSYHGFALNVTTDLAIFAGLDPCGFDAAVMTSLEAVLGRAPAMADVRAAVVAAAREAWPAT